MNTWWKGVGVIAMTAVLASVAPDVTPGLALVLQSAAAVLLPSTLWQLASTVAAIRAQHRGEPR